MSVNKILSFEDWIRDNRINFETQGGVTRIVQLYPSGITIRGYLNDQSDLKDEDEDEFDENVDTRYEWGIKKWAIYCVDMELAYLVLEMAYKEYVKLNTPPVYTNPLTIKR